MTVQASSSSNNLRKTYLGSSFRNKFSCFLIIIVMVNEAQSLCTVTENPASRQESYQRYEYSSYYGSYQYNTYYKTVVYGITKFTCTNSTMEEVHTSNAGQTTRTHFIVKDSFLNSLAKDDKAWPRVTSLILDNANISTIEPRFFAAFTELVNLSITNNHIPNLVDGVFTSLANLQKLNLSNNSIEFLGPQLFANLTNLNLLNLSSNHIVDLPDNILMSVNNSLSRLDLSENMLIRVRNNLNVSSLKKVFLNRNNLVEFDFLNLTNTTFEILDLSQNNITNATNLEIIHASTVNLSYNHIEHLYKIGNISTFNISHNRFKVLENNFVSDSVIDLDLSFNDIDNVSLKAFAQSTKLKKLNLHHNNITALPTTCFQTLESLEYLDLSHNKILFLEFGTFNKLKNLKYLNVSYNKGLVDFHSFLRVSLLENIEFENNTIKNFNTFFFDTHKNLSRVTMGENSWNCSELIKIIHLMESKNIFVTEGHVNQFSNIHGIGCDNEFKINKTIAENLVEENNTNDVYIIVNLVFCNILLLTFLGSFLFITIYLRKQIGRLRQENNELYGLVPKH